MILSGVIAVIIIFMSFDLKHSIINELSYEPSYENSMSFTIALSSLTLSMVIIGSFLVSRLRKYFRCNYYQHSNSIILSIVLAIISGGSIMSPFVVKILDYDYDSQITDNNNWNYAIFYFATVFVC